MPRLPGYRRHRRHPRYPASSGANRCVGRVGPVGGSLVAAFAVAITISSSANAFERQWHVGGDLGLAHLANGSGAPDSSDLFYGAHATYGISDTFNLIGDLILSHHPGPLSKVFSPSTPFRSETALSAAVGVAYTFDVLRWVPYGGVLVGGYEFLGNRRGTAIGPQLALGLDYQLVRDWSLGAEVKYHWLAFTTHGVDGSSYATAGLRAAYVFGW